jgi:hypothetical protein
VSRLPTDEERSPVAAGTTSCGSRTCGWARPRSASAHPPTTPATVRRARARPRRAPRTPAQTFPPPLERSDS